MVERSFWLEKLRGALAQRSVVWLSGVRRVGKTVLVQSLEDIEYCDCELLRVRDDVRDPETFLRERRGKIVVFDEIHRLQNPSELLKVAADHFPDIRVIATGSSTLGASSKFRDTLAGRKETLWLTPMVQRDLVNFGNEDWHHRLLHGGLPQFFLAETFPEGGMQEWMDAYFAKDVQELFRLERRSSFLRFAELLFVQSGGIFEASRFTGPCEVSRRTITNYLAMLEATYLVHIVRPFSIRRSTEIVKAPKVYAFDTGFVATANHWRELHEGEKGILWEHVVLNEIQATLQLRTVQYWREKNGHEVDFILAGRGDIPTIAIECKWGGGEYDKRSVRAFLRHYPHAHFYVVQPHARGISRRKVDSATIAIVDLPHLMQEVLRLRSKP